MSVPIGSASANESLAQQSGKKTTREPMMNLSEKVGKLFVAQKRGFLEKKQKFTGVAEASPFNPNCTKVVLT